MAQKRKLRFRVFRSSTKSWETLCQEIADFVSQFDEGKVQDISQSQHGVDGVMIVWYWE